MDINAVVMQECMAKGYIMCMYVLLSYCCLPMQNGASALMCASQKGHEQVVDVLLRGGASPQLQTKVA